MSSDCKMPLCELRVVSCNPKNLQIVSLWAGSLRVKSRTSWLAANCELFSLQVASHIRLFDHCLYIVAHIMFQAANGTK